MFQLPRRNYEKNSFSYRGAILWNNLPCDIGEAESVGQLKSTQRSTIRIRGKQLFI